MTLLFTMEDDSHPIQITSLDLDVHKAVYWRLIISFDHSLELPLNSSSFPIVGFPPFPS